MPAETTREVFCSDCKDFSSNHAYKNLERAKNHTTKVNYSNKGS